MKGISRIQSLSQVYPDTTKMKGITVTQTSSLNQVYQSYPGMANMKGICKVQSLSQVYSDTSKMKGISVPRTQSLDQKYQVYPGMASMKGIYKTESLDQVGNFDKALSPKPSDSSVWSVKSKLPIRKRGLYTICIKSSDGSNLQIHRTKLITSDGSRGPLITSGAGLQGSCAQKYLKRGRHLVKATGLQAGNDASIRLSYSSPGTKTRKKYMRVLHKQDPNQYHGDYAHTDTQNG
jgi:hypothetical protein